jgi:hypothetical protein
MAKTIKIFAFYWTSLFICTGPVMLAQLPDGTRSTVGWIEEIKKNQAEEEKLVFNEALESYTANLSVVAYVIRDVNGMSNCT